MKTRLALALTLLAACADSRSDLSRILPEGDVTVLAVAGDFKAAGILTAVGVPSLEVKEQLIDGVVSNDPKIRKLGDRVFIINRDAHNIVVLDAKSGQFLDQIATGNKSNPQDAALYENHLYVAALGRGAVLDFDLALANVPPELLDLSKLDPDGLPDCNSVAVIDDRLVVACGVLDENSKPRENGKVAIFNLRKPKEEPQVISLPDKNPFGWLEPLSDTQLAISLVPSFADMKKGCLARIDVKTARAQCLISNQALGGYAGSYQRRGDNELVIAVTTGFDETDFGPLAQVVRLIGGDNVEVMSATTPRRFDVAICPSGHTVFAEARAGLRVVDAGGFELTTHALSIGLAPVQNGLICY